MKLDENPKQKRARRGKELPQPEASKVYVPGRDAVQEASRVYVPPAETHQVHSPIPKDEEIKRRLGNLKNRKGKDSERGAKQASKEARDAKKRLGVVLEEAEDYVAYATHYNNKMRSKLEKRFERKRRPLLPWKKKLAHDPVEEERQIISQLPFNPESVNELRDAAWVAKMANEYSTDYSSTIPDTYNAIRSFQKANTTGDKKDTRIRKLIQAHAWHRAYAPRADIGRPDFGHPAMGIGGARERSAKKDEMRRQTIKGESKSDERIRIQRERFKAAHDDALKLVQWIDREQADGRKHRFRTGLVDQLRQMLVDYDDSKTSSESSTKPFNYRKASETLERTIYAFMRESKAGLKRYARSEPKAYRGLERLQKELKKRHRRNAWAGLQLLGSALTVGGVPHMVNESTERHEQFRTEQSQLDTGKTYHIGLKIGQYAGSSEMTNAPMPEGYEGAAETLGATSGMDELITKHMRWDSYSELSSQERDLLQQTVEALDTLTMSAMLLKESSLSVPEYDFIYTRGGSAVVEAILRDAQNDAYAPESGASYAYAALDAETIRLLEGTHADTKSSDAPLKKLPPEVVFRLKKIAEIAAVIQRADTYKLERIATLAQEVKAARINRTGEEGSEDAYLERADELARIFIDPRKSTTVSVRDLMKDLSTIERARLTSR